MRAAGRMNNTPQEAKHLSVFSRGGLKILEKIEQQDYNVLGARPVISKIERVGLLLGAITRRAFARASLSVRR